MARRAQSRHHHPGTDGRRTELSQHFLRDPRLARTIVDALRLPRGSLVLEIGAGRGIITQALADAGFRVIVVEQDGRLFRSLRARFIGRTNIECHHADALEFAAPRVPHAVVSNVPYHITAAVVRGVMTSAAADAALIVQREAAQKFAGVPAESLFSLLHKPSFEITIGRAFERTDFDPPPSVESVLLRLHRRAVPLLEPREAAAYRSFILASFGSRRQRARDALRLHVTERQLVRVMHDLGIPRDARPSGITFAQWLAIFRVVQRLRVDAWPRGRTPRAPAVAAVCGERPARSAHHAAGRVEGCELRTGLPAWGTVPVTAARSGGQVAAPVIRRESRSGREPRGPGRRWAPMPELRASRVRRQGRRWSRCA